MFDKILPENTKKVLLKLKGQDFLKSFYLSGGTGLALQIGHRESEDLDFFSEHKFDSFKLLSDLKENYNIENSQASEGTLNCFLEGTKLQFLHYPYKLLENPIIWEGVNISSKIDIACTKLITISSRGSKKDFIDIYFLLKEYSLLDLITELGKKYNEIDYNLSHILKSLVYFEDARLEPMPRMHSHIEWVDVERTMLKEIENFEI